MEFTTLRELFEYLQGQYYRNPHAKIATYAGDAADPDKTRLFVRIEWNDEHDICEFS